jgi:hypothetical protein
VTILLGVLYYGCFNFICFVIYVWVFVIHLLCSVVYLPLLFCSYFVVLCLLCFVVALCIFIFVCTSVGRLPPGESPIVVSNKIIIII